MNEKKKGIIVITLICICVCIGLVFGGSKLLHKNKKASKTTSTEPKSGSTTVKSSEKTTKENKSSKNESGDSNADNPDAVNSSSSSGDPRKKGKTLKYPYTIPNSKVKVTRFDAYTGVYVEDGSNKKLKKRAAIEIKNDSKKAITYGTLTVKSNGKKIKFSFSTIPAGSSAIVFAQGKEKFTSSTCTYEDSLITYADSLSLLKSDISIKKADNNGITVKNLTDKKIPCVRVFYKYKLKKKYYIGGITFTAKITNLGAGKSTTVYPSHYETKGSEVMMVRTYDSDN